MKNHQKHRELFENCATRPLEVPEEKWEELFKILALPPSCQEFVLWILHKGGWRKEVDPVQYVRAAVRKEQREQERRRASKFPIPFSAFNLPRNEDGTTMGRDEAIDYLNPRSLEDSWETPYVELRVRREFRGGEQWDEDGQYTVNFSKVMDEVAELAGLSKVQRDAIEVVLHSRGRLGLSRNAIMACPPAERRLRQAAWKWIERNKALLAKVLKPGIEG